MNKNRQNLPIQTKKKIEKAIKEGQKALRIPEELPRTDTLTPKKALAKYPPKLQKAEKPLMKAVVREMEIKKKKKLTKHSKRTTPGEVDFRDAAPASVHPESTRWKKTGDLQSRMRGKALSAKLRKKK